MNHLSLTVSDRTVSEPFYQAILGFMGYQQVENTDDLLMWWSASAGAITLAAARPDSCHKTHDRSAPGLHHFAFNADNRQQVDDLYVLLQNLGATILAPPDEYPQYAPGYYAIYFTDPDGIKLELVHMPTLP